MANADVHVTVVLHEGTFERLSLGPDDAVIAHVDALLTHAQATQLAEYIKRQLKIDRVLVVGKAVTISIGKVIE